MGQIKPATLAGFMELLPEDQAVFNQIKDIIRQVFEDNAFKAIETPVIERKEILLAKGGGETSKQIYYIDHDSRDMALRFDLTVPLARYVAEHYHELSFPFRRYQIGKVYRGERNQKGRYKEFYQCDIDIVGDRDLDIRNDAEIPAVIYQAFASINLKQVTFNMNNRKLLNGFFRSLGQDNYTEILRVIDKKDKLKADKFDEELAKVIEDVQARDRVKEFILIGGSNREIIDQLKSMDLDNDQFNQGLEEIELVYNYMKMFSIPEDAIQINLSISRGLDYYTGTVFETFLNGYESIGSICSGGRYDDLASNFTKNKLPGVGMSIGLSRLYYQLIQADLIDIPVRPACELLIVPMAGTYQYAMELLNQVRKSDIRCQIYFEDAKFKKIFNYADKENINYVLIAGQDEMDKGEVSLKDMTSGDQKSLALEEAISLINKNKGE